MVSLLAQAQEVSFPTSAFVPLAVGFFGLGTGYLIYGPQELFKLPGRDRAVDLTTGYAAPALAKTAPATGACGSRSVRPAARGRAAGRTLARWGSGRSASSTSAPACG
jgi:hypothetical protein